MTLSEELIARGFIQQHTGEALGDIFDAEPRIVYHGIDPSADSAHAGNMVVWLFLRHLADHGHRIIFLVGGGTGMIGDPKPDAERVLQDESITDAAVTKIQAQATRLIGGTEEITFVNNKEWLLAENLIHFLRDIGKHFTVNELIKKDAIAKRLESESGISYTEFAYPLLQGYDYLVLNRKFDCDVQVGGSDQWGNIVAGVDLIRRKEQKVVHAVTVPLVVDRTTGKKFGKSEGNAVWLDASKTSPFAFYQFWFNVDDESVIEYLKLFTMLSLGEIGEIEHTFRENPGTRSAQRALASAVTEFVHGKDVADAVAHVSDVLFGEKGLTGLSASEQEILLASAPTCPVTAGTSLVDVVLGSGLAASKREARTFIESGAISLGGGKVTDVEQVLLSEDFENGLALVRRGKKQVCVLVMGA